MINILFTQDFPINLILFSLVAIALLFSIVLHELGHGYVAKWNGDDTAYEMGRLSINPVKHFDIMGFVMLMFIGFGYAKPVPINPYNFRNYKKGCFAVSIAGVTVNFILAIISSAVYVIIAVYGDTSNLAIMLLELFFYYVSRFNLTLMFFNLLPLAPLDGFRLIESLTKRENRFTTFLRMYGHYILLALFVLSVIVGRSGLPIWFSPLDIYMQYTATGLHGLLIKFWMLIFV